MNPGTKTVGIAAIVLHTGKVLLLGGKNRTVEKSTAAYLYDPVAKTGHEVTAPAAVFCSGITILADGRVLSAGGADPVPKGVVDLWLFNPITEQWTRQIDTPLGRYYPTATKLSDGQVLITAGTQLDGRTRNPTSEIYTPPTAAEPKGSLELVGGRHVTAFYPRQFVMPDGNVLQVDGGRAAYQFNTVTKTWKLLPSMPERLGQGAPGLMLPGDVSGSNRVLMIGGTVQAVGQSHTMTFDYANPSAGWKFGNPLPQPRGHMNLVQLPDGSAIGIGGNSTGLYEVGQMQTLGYDPSTDTWADMAVQSVRRAYHSSAVLLPDGRIMSAGDTGASGGRQRIDYYSPPYLFQGARPVIDSVPTELQYGQSFDIAISGAQATNAVLMAPAATTHADEMHARHVELAVTPGAGGLTATAPTANLAPPGYYMLFILTPDGIPSEAAWVHITS